MSSLAGERTLHVGFRRFSWAFVVVTLAVILWGTFVRASLSGDGCGDHWPLCNGEVIPTAPSTKTLAELAHRLTSGLAFALAVVGVIASRRIYPAGHRVRRGSAAVLLLMITEALVGAGLVLFRMVADNPSMARAPWMAAHLVNTFFLLAALTLTALWASGWPAPRLRGRGRLGGLLGTALAGTLLVAVSGAVAALGDTLFPSMSLREALRADLSPASHLWIQLRALHPVLAVGAGLPILLAAGTVWAQPRGAWARRCAAAVGGLLLAQLGLGLLNVALLAPVWMQLVHLLVADLLWIALVALGSASLSPTDAHSTVTAIPAHGTPRSASSTESA